MASFARVWPAAASAFLLWAAFPPLNLGLLVFVAIAPWLASLKGTTSRGAMKSGYVFGFLYILLQMNWLQPLVYRWTHDTALSFVPLLAAPAIGGLYFVLGGWLIWVCWQRKWPWAIPMVWSAIEVLRAYMPGLAFPWGLLGTPLWPYPSLIQLAWFGTIFMVSAWLALGNVILAQFLSGEKVVAVRPYAFAFIFLAVLSVVRFSNKPTGAKTPITIGQLGLDLAFGDKLELANQLGPTVESFRAATMLQKSRLLVLPEGLVRGGNGLPPPIPFSTTGNVPILFGGQRGDGPRYQSAYAYDGTWKYVDKTRLVVFGEYVPGRGIIPFLDAFKLPTGDLMPGDEVKSLEVAGLRVGPLLCFEGLFPDVALAQADNDAQLLAVMSLDDWYFGTAAPEQLMSASVFRAVETGLPVVRAAPLGYSVAVQANGEIIARAPLGKTIPMRVELTVPNGPERFPGSGWWVYAFPVCGIAIWVAGLAHRKSMAQSKED